MYRQYAGEELEPLSLGELQSLEQQLGIALKRIRTRKVCSFFTFPFSGHLFFSFSSSTYIYIYMEFMSRFYTHCISALYLQNQLMHEAISQLQKKVIKLHSFFLFPFCLLCLSNICIWMHPKEPKVFRILMITFKFTSHEIARDLIRG